MEKKWKNTYAVVSKSSSSNFFRKIIYIKALISKNAISVSRSHGKAGCNQNLK